MQKIMRLEVFLLKAGSLEAWSEHKNGTAQNSKSSSRRVLANALQHTSIAHAACDGLESCLEHSGYVRHASLFCGYKK